MLIFWKLHHSKSDQKESCRRSFHKGREQRQAVCKEEEKKSHSLLTQGENNSHNKPNCRVSTFFFSLKGHVWNMFFMSLRRSRNLYHDWLLINTPKNQFYRRWVARGCVCCSSSPWIKGKVFSSWPCAAAGLSSIPTQFHNIPNLAFHNSMLNCPPRHLLFTVSHFPLSLPPESLPATTSPFCPPSFLLCASQR